MNGVWSGRLEAATIAAGAAYAYHTFKDAADGGSEQRDDDYGVEYDDYSVDYERELAETRELMRELRSEVASLDPLAIAIDKPVNGDYSGETAEDDGGDQEARTTLRFGRDGRITGEGHDGVDGRYVIHEGHWSQRRVAWLEKYDEGFTVALRGQVRPDGTIVALWASSVGVGGAVSLAPPARD